MPKGEFEFPEPEPSTEIEVEPVVNRVAGVLEPLELEDIDIVDDGADAGDDGGAGEDVDVEVVDDTPPEDRDKPVATKDTDVDEGATEGDLRGYSRKVQKRIKKANAHIHEQRRRAEKAERERDELVNWAKGLVQENDQLKQNSTRGHNSLIAQAKKTAATEVEAAEKELEHALEEGDSGKIAKAHSRAAKAAANQTRVEQWKPKPLQTSNNPVKQKHTRNLQGDNTQPNPHQPVQRTTQDPKFESWREENTWFDTDPEMRATALGVHTKLLGDGIDGKHPEYYKRLDARMKQLYPDEFQPSEATDVDTPDEPNPESVVAPATRSSAPKKIKLTKTQVSMAKRLGVPLDRYAQENAKLTMKEKANG